MEKKYRNTFLLLGGAALLGGAWYYLQQRRKVSSYEHMLSTFSTEFFQCEKSKLRNMQMRFDQIFYAATQKKKGMMNTWGKIDNVFQRLSQWSPSENYQPSIEGIHLGHCGKLLKSGAIYYECWDCSTVRREIKDSRKKSEENCVYMSICDDCFDVSKHKGHHFQRYSASNEEIFRCSCGDDCLMEETTFCDNHQGYTKIRSEFEQSQNEGENNSYKKDQKKETWDVWERFEAFFLDMFHVLFDESGKAIFGVMVGDKKHAMEIKDHFNVLLQFIMDKMTEVMEMNKYSAIFLGQLLRKTLRRAISIDIELEKNDPEKLEQKKRWKLLLRSPKRINTNLTVLEYIFMYSKLINSTNDELISPITQKCIKADPSFRNFFSEKFFQLIFFIFKTEVIAIPNSIETITRGMFPLLSHTMIEQVSIQSVFNHLVSSLGEQIFIPLDLFITHLLNKPDQVMENDEVIYLLFNICFEMFKQIKMLALILRSHPRSLIEKMGQLSFALFQRNVIIIDKEKQSQTNNLVLDCIGQLLNSLHLMYLEQQMLLCYINLCEGISLINDPILTSELLPYLIQEFKKLLISSMRFVSLNKTRTKELITLSLSIISHLPLLIALDSKTMFTRDSVSSFFAQHLQFDQLYPIQSHSHHESQITTETTTTTTETTTAASTTQKDQIPNSQHHVFSSMEESCRKDSDICFLSLTVLFDTFILSNTNIGFCNTMRTTKKQLNQTTPNGRQIYSILESLESYLVHPQMRLYDAHILTYQILQLGLPPSLIDTLHVNIFLRQLIFFEDVLKYLPIPVHNDETYLILQKAIFMTSDITEIILQILFDTTPFINMFSDTSGLYFPELAQKESKGDMHSIKAKFDDNVSQCILTAIHAKEQTRMFMKDIELISKSVLHYTSELSPYLHSICIPHKTEPSPSFVLDEEIMLIPNSKGVIYPRNIIRNISEIDIVLTRFSKQHKPSAPLMSIIGTDSKLDSLLPHQQGIIELFILNLSYQQKLTSIVIKETKCPLLSLFFGQIIHLTLLFILDGLSHQQKEQTNILNLKAIAKIYQEPTFFNQLNKQIEEELTLSKKLSTDQFQKALLQQIQQLLAQIKLIV